MPPRKRKSTLGRSTANAKRTKIYREQQTEEERQQRLETLRLRASTLRADETTEERQQRIEDLRVRASTSRADETTEERQRRIEDLRVRASTSRADETTEERQRRIEDLRVRASTSRADETTEERQRRIEDLRVRASTSRADETTEERQQRIEDLRVRASTSRADETMEEREKRQETDRVRASTSRAVETDERRSRRVDEQRGRQSRVRNSKWSGKEGSAFAYDRLIDYEPDDVLSLGTMSVVCPFCAAKKWKDETSGMCCASGKVRLPELQPPPEPLLMYLTGETNESVHFLSTIRRYNSVFQMTSFGGHVCVEDGFMPTFKIQGQVYHQIGSLLPAENEAAKFLQLYFVGDTDVEVKARCNIMGVNGDGRPNVRSVIVAALQRMIHQCNPYVRDLKAVVEWNQDTDELPELSVIIHADRKPTGDHAGRYNAPTTNEVAIVLVNQHIGERRDIVMKTRDGRLSRIAEMNRAYDCLQYPLMFCYGEDGYRMTDLQVNPRTGEPTNKKISCMDFYAYRMMVRGTANYLLYYRALTNQFWVDMYAKIETERLNFVRYNQAKLRAEDYVHLQDAIARDGHVENVGQLVILPSSFTGGPRYMHERMQDAMTYVRHYFHPDLFITMTCNPQWKEIQDELFLGQKAQDRYDIVSRVFNLKVKKMMDYLTKQKIFGTVSCFTYSIEWQKRGLPHVHILVWLQDRINPNQVDTFISAEIPDKEEDPLLYAVVTRSMIHGPCGALNPRSVCMKDGLCTKKFPKKFVFETQTGEDGYPMYRRRSPVDGGRSFKLKLKSGGKVDVDNRWVVPYCPFLLRTFNTHINVESCKSIRSIKYICKYVHKGSDQATIQMRQNQQGGNGNDAGVNDGQNNDEVLSFQTGRYLSSSEATWRILGFPIHDHSPTVTKLDVHLENGQRVYFTTANVPNVLQRAAKSTLLGFFELCRNDGFARTLLYQQVPQYYTLDQRTKKWSRRIRGHALGRVYTVHPNNTECYFLRMLLHVVPGPTSFENIRTVDGVVCQTYQLACLRLGLLEDDEHWKKTLNEAALSHTPRRLRYLFAVMLAVCQVNDAKALWDVQRENLAEDILYQFRRQSNNSQLPYSDVIFNKALLLLQDLLDSLSSRKLSDFGLPVPVPEAGRVQHCVGEDEYDIDALQVYVAENEPKLIAEQRAVYNEIMDSVNQQLGRIFFLDASGGTGKTFLMNLILNNVRSTERTVFAVASSGIAATLLQGGKTAHSTFKLPLNLQYQEEPVCSLKKGSKMANLLRECVLVVWDECTMSNKKAVEAVDRSLRDITGKNVLMGGITFLFSGDFRQTLPVIAKGTRADEVHACLKSSYIWPAIQRVRLHTNMRVHLQGNAEAAHFSNLLLQIGEGKRDCNGNDEVAIYDDLGKVVDSIDVLISEVYPDLRDLQLKSSEWFCERSILSPRNDKVTDINNSLLDSCSAQKVMYKSIDSTLKNDDAVHFPTEFLNSLDLPGLPPHKLNLKVHAPIMLLRNLDAPRLCNGTRLRIVRLQPNVLEAEILTGCAKGEIVFIPRIPMIPNDEVYAFKRLQFPIRLCFAMTINKAQGQTLRVVGVDLRTSCFSHGQLYVACSRVTGSDGLFLLAANGRTRNVVYPEVLNRF